MRIIHTTIEDAKQHCIGLIDRDIGQNPDTRFYIGKSFLLAKSAADGPNSGESDTDELNSGESDTDEPNSGESDTDEPNSGESDTDEPNSGESDTDGPSSGESDTDGPSSGESDIDEPNSGEIDLTDDTTFDGTKGLSSRWKDAIKRRKGNYNKLFVIAVIKREWIEKDMIRDVKHQCKYKKRSVYEKCALLIEKGLIKHYKIHKPAQLDNKSEKPGNIADPGTPVFLVYLCVYDFDLLPITPASEERNKKQLKAQKRLSQTTQQVKTNAQKAITKAQTTLNEAQEEMTQAKTQAMTKEITEGYKALTETMTKVQTALSEAQNALAE